MGRATAQAVATVCSGIFFGAALYISLVQHPAAMDTGQAFASRFFPPMYERAAVMQASLALIGTGAAGIAFFLGAGRAWLVAALLLGSVVPFTLFVMSSVNAQVTNPLNHQSSVPAPDLLARWARLHLVRTGASGLSFLMCVLATLRRAA